MTRTAWAVAAVALGLTACTSQPGDLTAAAQRVLVPKAQAVRDAAHSGSYSRLDAAVRSLANAVDREQQRGQVSQSRAVAIKDAADTLLSDFTPSPTATPTPTQTTPSSTPTSPSPSPTPTSPSPSPSESSSPAPSQSSTPGTTVSLGGVDVG